MPNLNEHTLGDVSHQSNKAKITGPYPDNLKSILCLNDTDKALAEIQTWAGYEPTPLYTLAALAKQIGVGEIYYKDEGPRFGLGSFKALGGAYGVLKFLQRHLSKTLGENVTFNDIRGGKYKHLTSAITLVTATDGNHGRAVASGAKRFDCKCRIYIHAEVSQGRQSAMEALGAEVIRIEGDYDESVRFCTEEAKKNGWHIISDTSFDDYIEVPADIMAGYTVLAAEISDQLQGKPLPTHIFLQGGVGSVASAICAYFWEKYPDHAFKFIVVEPNRAPCLFASAKAGVITEVEVKRESIMAGLSCGVPSKISWKIISQGVNDFITIGDEAIPHMMRLLAKPYADDPAIVGGESGVAGLAGLVAASKIVKTAKALGLDQRSFVLVIGTEGATDPEIYKNITHGPT
jgi:diaminopropionate ammonia-lyase